MAVFFSIGIGVFSKLPFFDSVVNPNLFPGFSRIFLPFFAKRFRPTE